MKLLQNKSTGEIGCLVCSFGKTPEKITVVQYIDGKRGSKVWYYASLAELNREWQDYEEPISYPYLINPLCEGHISRGPQNFEEEEENADRLGFKFDTFEDAKKAVEKLKAWKRLKDKGFRFTGFSGGRTIIEFTFDKHNEPGSAYDDLKLLFGGEE